MRRALLTAATLAVLALGVITGYTQSATPTPPPAVGHLLDGVAGQLPAETDAGVVSDELGPKRVTVGKPEVINYGGEDIASFTVTKVDRCRGYVRVTATLTTGKLYTMNDFPFQNFMWVDAAGITHTNLTPSPSYLTGDYEGVCGEDLPDWSTTEAGRKYAGILSFELPPNAATLSFGDYDLDVSKL